jgi:hypothetical protein
METAKFPNGIVAIKGIALIGNFWYRRSGRAMILSFRVRTCNAIMSAIEIRKMLREAFENAFSSVIIIDNRFYGTRTTRITLENSCPSIRMDNDFTCYSANSHIKIPVARLGTNAIIVFWGLATAMRI